MVRSLLDIIRADREMIVAPGALPTSPLDTDQGLASAAVVLPYLDTILDALLAYWEQHDEKDIQTWAETYASLSMRDGRATHQVLRHCDMLAQRLRTRLGSYALPQSLVLAAGAQLDAGMALLYRTYLEAYAALTASHLARVHEYAQVAQRHQELELLYDLSQQVGYTLEYDTLVRLLLAHLPRIVPHDVSASILWTGGLCHLYLRPMRPVSTEIQDEIQRRLLHGFIRMRGYMPELKPEHLHVHRLEPDAGIAPQPLMTRLDSLFQVPIIVGEHHDIAALLCVGAECLEAFSEEHVRLFYTVASQAALSLQRVRTMLAETQQQLENILEHLPNGVLLIDANHRLVVANPIARVYLKALTDTDCGAVLYTLGERLLEGLLQPAPEGQHHEIEVDGPPARVFEVDARPVGDAVAVGWVLVLRDVTEDRRGQERIQQQERLAAVGQLAAGIAHDFNNLLSGIIGFAEILQKAPDVPEAARDMLGKIILQGERGAHMVHQILDFSRVSVSTLQPVNLGIFLSESVDFLRSTLPENLHIVLELLPGEHMVCADVTRLQQVLVNLAINTRDASPAGGELRMRLSHFTQQPGDLPACPDMPPGAWKELTIADTGTGIAADILPYIFEPFFTTKGPRQGAGMGLAQVYGIVKQHSGYLHIDSRVGVGTTLHIYLPALLPQDMPSPASPLLPLSPEKREGHGEAVLVVEDDAMVLEVCSAILEELGYQVLSATNGKQALEAYRIHQERIALVLTDMAMPEMDGMALFMALREINPHLKVIVMTGYPLMEEGRQLLAQGVLAWLQKPLQFANLSQILAQVLAE